MQDFELAFLFSLVVTLFTIPLVKKLAKNVDMLDRPSSERLSKHPIPLLGGIGVFLGFCSSFVLFGEFQNNMFYIIAGSSAMLLFGLIDDKYNLDSKAKFIVPFAFTIIIVVFGIRTQFLGNFYLDCIFSFLWIFGLVNSFNFLDNMDGICGGVCAISSFCFGLIALITDQDNLAILSFALSGSTLGFLYFNFNPAKIYLGDGGSLFLGFTMACIGIEGTWGKGSGNLDQFTSMTLIPIFILAYPIFDTSCVVFWRLANSKLPWLGDVNHTTHKLLRLGLSTRQVTFIIYLITSGFGIGAFLINDLKTENRLLLSLMMILFLFSFFLIVNNVKFKNNLK